jgi:hypothetical protein
MEINLDAVKALLDWLDSSPTDCDGFSNLAYAALLEAEVPSELMIGCVTIFEEDFAPHYWVQLQLDAEYIVDYRSHRWVSPEPLPVIPRGIFRAEDYPEVIYAGMTLPIQEAHKKEYAFLMRSLLTHSFEMDLYLNKHLYGS